MKFEILILVYFLAVQCVSGKNILFYFGFSGYSHRISVWPLVEKLVEKGHNITFFSPMPPKKPNPLVTEITPENLLKDLGLTIDLLNLRVSEGKQGINQLWPLYINFGINHCTSMLKRSDIVNWINSSSYDLVVINGLFNDCALGLVHKFNSKYIIYGTMSSFAWWTESYGYPHENMPEFMYSDPLDMTFLQSVSSALRPLYWYWSRIYYMFPRLEEAIKTGLKINDLPPLSEIERNASLVFLNTYSSEEYARSLSPMFVNVGGMHCNDNRKPLSEDIKKFVESGDGFIYFSFGTFAKAGNLPKNVQDMIFGAMKKFTKTKFLVKWDGDAPAGLPENVKASQWVSQQDVLSHPAIRGFISHGGLLGTQEAVYYGVPTIVLPLFADQDYNADRVAERKRGIKLEISTLTQTQLEDAIQELLEDNTYMENSKVASRLFKDRPQHPADTALWWVEYVLRNKDTSHLRPIGINKNWYQRRMLDIWAFIAVVFLGLLALVCLTLYGLTKAILKTSKTPIRSSKKNK